MNAHGHVSIREYLLSSNVQLGATYATGTVATERYNAGYAAAAEYINASRDEVGGCCPQGFIKRDSPSD